MLTKRLSAIVLMACLLVALAFGGVAAWAAVSWWSGGDNELTVNACDDKAEFKDDLTKNADVRVDVIKIATASPHEADQAFYYELDEGFEGLTLPSDPDAEDWQNLANEAAEIAKDKITADGTAKAGTAISLNGDDYGDGLYLVLAHGKDVKDLYADSKSYRYTFQPSLVAMPSKKADEKGEIHTDASYGDWETKVTINLKPSQEPLYGDIEIVKSVPDFKGEKATFVYHLYSKKDGGETYDNFAAVQYPNPGSTVVTHVPAGIEIVVEEVDPGPRYTVNSTNPVETTTVANKQVSVSFQNKPNGSNNNGHGIENNFKVTESGWEWTATPAQDGSESTK